jgi:hypothetical protein
VRVAVVSHDAGGAEILSSWVNHTQHPVTVVVAGPAESIFRHKCPHAEFLPLKVALHKSSWVLCGTGWQSDFERQAIVSARALGKKTVSFLDHWVNFRERFVGANNYVLPDEIWVGDIEAERIARAQFVDIPIILQPNHYIEDLLVEISRIRKPRSDSIFKRILYVCEPIAQHSLLQFGNEHHWGYTEHEALSFFLNNVSALGRYIGSITIRPHPSEPKDKYDRLRNLYSLTLVHGGQKTLLEEILESDIVVGCDSMAMVVGLLASKRVVSSIPPGGRECQLPHKNIENLQELIKADIGYG